MRKYIIFLKQFDVINYIPGKQAAFEDALATIYESYSGFNYTNAFWDTDRAFVYDDVPSLFKSLLGPYESDETVLGKLRIELGKVFDDINQYQIPMEDAVDLLLFQTTSLWQV